MGNKDTVDLPLSVQQSNYFLSIKKREAAGEMPQKSVTDINTFANF
jgi:hypothetical protein